MVYWVEGTAFLSRQKNLTLKYSSKKRLQTGTRKKKRSSSATAKIFSRDVCEPNAKYLQEETEEHYDSK